MSKQPYASEYEGSIRFSPKEVKKIKRTLKQPTQQAESANTAASGVHAEALKKSLKLISSKEADLRQSIRDLQKK